MRSARIQIICALILIGMLVIIPAPRLMAQPVVFSIETSTGKDTLWYGQPGSIIFKADPNGANIVGLTFPLEFHFSNGNIISTPLNCLSMWYYTLACGGLDPCENVWPTDEITDPDSLLFGTLDFSLTCWPADNVVARLDVAFSDTGSFTIDSIYIPPANHLAAVDASATVLPIEWHPKTITVANCPVMMGDITQDGRLTSADIIMLVNYLFRSGPEPQPFWQIVDVDCSGTVTVADVLYIINTVYKGQDLPCACNTP